MADEPKATTVVDATVTPTPAIVDANAKPAGTPAPTAVDAAGKQGKTYDEAHVKQLIADRDAAKARADQATADAEKTFLSSDKGKQFLELQRKADEAAAAAAKTAEAESLARGEHLKVIAAHDADIAKLKTDHEVTVKSYRDAMVRRDFEVAVRGVGALPNAIEDTHGQLAKALADGTVSVNDKGEIIGLAALVRKLVEAKPHWFTSGAVDALKRLETAQPGIIQAAATTLDTREAPPNPTEPTSLSRPSRLSKQMAGAAPKR